MNIEQIMTPGDLQSLNRLVGAALFNKDLETLLLEKRFTQVARTYDISDSVWAWLTDLEIHSLTDLSRVIFDQWTRQINTHFWPEPVEIEEPEEQLIYFEQRIIHAVA